MNSSIFSEIKDELLNDILPYWENHSKDYENKGFFGEIDNNNVCNKKISRSIVMTSRFLWAFSAAARLTKNSSYLKTAEFAYEIIKTKYIDYENGGVFWSVTPEGRPDVSKKQIYGQAFCCYGLSEFAAAQKELKNNIELACESMNESLKIFDLLEKFALDSKDGGYVEARAKNWAETKDMILSPKDMNCPKSMNTNLHVMEAYTNLYRTLPVIFSDSPEQKKVGNSLKNLILVTVEKILQKNGHLGMFFDMNWNLLFDEFSYGHDIEASWLLWEAACELKDENLKSQIRKTVIFTAEVALNEGFDIQNGCMENFLRNGKRNRNRVWWNQAEALNGFYNAWEMTGEKKFEDAVELQWKWIRDFQVDKKGGEWWAELDENAKPILKEPKGGNWKTAYHSARACMELLRRSNNI